MTLIRHSMTEAHSFTMKKREREGETLKYTLLILYKMRKNE